MTRSRTHLVAAMLVAAWMVSWLPAAAADGHGTRGSILNGTVTVLHGPDGPPAIIADCDFWVQGRGLVADHGTIEADYGGATRILGEWRGIENELGRFDFVAGPFRVDVDEEWEEWRIRAVFDGGATLDDPQHFEPCPDGRDDDDDGAPDEGACADDLDATPLENGDVQLRWTTPQKDVSSFRILRDGETLAEVQTNELLDETSVPGVTYRYEVIAELADGKTDSCGAIEVTAIPYFGAPLVTTLALAGAILGLACTRRRS